MAMKLLTVSDFDPTCLVLKKPVKVTPELSISELWYKDGSVPSIPIIVTPQLKVFYGARSFEQEETRSISYCVSTWNQDIDDDIDEFYNMVQSIDANVGKLFLKTKTKTSDLPFSRVRYWSSIQRKKGRKNKYMKLKLITKSGTKNVETKIKTSKGELVDFTAIQYGTFVKQMICPSKVYYNSTGIHLLWEVHQIVVCKSERVFLEVCLLNETQPSTLGPQTLPPPPPPPPLPPPSLSLSQAICHGPRKPKEKPQQKTTQQRAALSSITQHDIRNALAKLRKQVHKDTDCSESE